MTSLSIIFISIICISVPLVLIYLQLKKLIPSDAAPLNPENEAAKQRLVINAYERLALLCERIQPDKLAQRLQSPQLTAQAMSQSMIVMIQQEFDHNITQQIFVSDSLWNIISIAKDESLFDIIETTSTLPSTAESRELTQLLMQTKTESKLNLALSAIRKEAKQYVKV